MTAAPAITRAGKVKILPATEVSVHALEDFHQRMHPSRGAFLKRNWRWLYRVSERKSALPLVAVQDDVIVGHAGTIPVTLSIDGTEQDAKVYVDLATLPEVRRRGIGEMLTREWMSDPGIHLAIGYNAKSCALFLKCGWGTHTSTCGFKLFLRPEQHPRFNHINTRIAARLLGFATRAVWRARSHELAEISAFPVTPERCLAFAQVEILDRIHIPRSMDMLRWRVLEHPLRNEFFFLSLADDTQNHSALVRIYERQSYRRLHILSLKGNITKTKELSRFFGSIIRWASNADMHHLWYVTSDPAIIKAVRWWLPIINHIGIAYHATNTYHQELLERAPQLWECLDADFDLNYT